MVEANSVSELVGVSEEGVLFSGGPGGSVCADVLCIAERGSGRDLLMGEACL